MTGFADVASDPEKEEKGVWIRYQGDLWVRVARMWSPAFEACYQAKIEALGQKYGAAGIPEEDREGAMSDAIAETVLVDWIVDGDVAEDLTPIEVEPIPFDGATGREGQSVEINEELTVEKIKKGARWYRVVPAATGAMPTLQQIVPYSSKLAARLFRDPRYGDLYRTIRTLSNQAKRYRLSSLEVRAKN